LSTLYRNSTGNFLNSFSVPGVVVTTLPFIIRPGLTFNVRLCFNSFDCNFTSLKIDKLLLPPEVDHHFPLVTVLI